MIAAFGKLQAMGKPMPPYDVEPVTEASEDAVEVAAPVLCDIADQDLLWYFQDR